MPVVPIRYTGNRKDEYDNVVIPLRNQGMFVESYIRRLNKNEKTARARAEKKAAKERESAKKLLESVRKTEQRIKESRLEPKRKAYLSSAKRALDAGNVFVFKKTQMKNIGLSIDDIIKMLANYTNKKLIITVGKVKYVVNDNTRPRLLNLLTKSQEILRSAKPSGSDDAMIIEIEEQPSFSVEPFTPSNRNRKQLGAFFKYTHSTSLDLSRYGVFNEVIPSNYLDTCLVVALQNAGLDSAKLEKIKLMVKNRIIPKTDLEKVCESIETSIVLKTDDTKKSGRNVFGKKYSNSVHIGLLDEHYFLIETVPITSFALRNYNELKDMDDFNTIIKQKGKYYERDEKRYIDSYDVIKILLETKELLSPITLENQMIASTQFYDKVISEITNLEYDVEKCIEPINKKISKEEDYENLFFDFETTTNGQQHVPYLCCLKGTYGEKQINKTFYGEDCGIQMLHEIAYQFTYVKKGVRLIAHNATYDYRFIVNYLYNLQELSRGNRLISATGMFRKVPIQVKDSYHLITMPLRDFPKTFQIKNTQKEIMPYDLYTKERVANPCISIEEGLSFVADDDKEQFVKNIRSWSGVLCENETYNILEYSAYYCKMDCEILESGYNTFRKWILEAFSLDVDTILTSASLAHKYFIQGDCYEGVNALSGVPQMFIQKCVVGGRVMCAENKKNYISSYVGNDFDATSLYPSAMARLPGFLKGVPKVITDLSYDWLQQQDGYFVQIVVNSVGISRKFPLMSYVNENGVRTFTNEMIGKTMFVDKTTLEDLIHFQDISFSVVRGYYFDEGFNPKINEVIRYIFNERVKAKANKNAIQMVYKLIMNSGYGKSIMKPVDTDCKFFNIYNGREELDTFISRNYNWIKSFTQFGNTVKVEMVKILSTHTNIAQVGVSILSMSKRIMNEVMCSAEDNGIDIYYQDTDSMHLKDSDIAKLGFAFKTKYGRDLIGDALGQFHSDFDLPGCKDIVCSRSIFLGKKCYIDELQGTNKQGEKETGYHIRMKGIPGKVIEYTCKKLKYKTPFDMYADLYNGKEISFDLTNDGTKSNFKFNKNYTIHTVFDFKRRIKF
jgi:hypothetical protein